MNDKGAFHGEVFARPKREGDPVFGGLPGSYKEEGWNVYPEGYISWGPDDPDYRFLYAARTDCSNNWRIDLQRKEIWIMNGPAKSGGRTKYELTGMRPLNPHSPHFAPIWLGNTGDFVIATGGSGATGFYLYKRVK